VQGVIVGYDPATREGIVMCDADRSQYDLASDALTGSIFRSLRQGQRVNFELDTEGRATTLRIGAEADLGLTNVHLA
jgi:CspA family cold shock protein